MDKKKIIKINKPKIEPELKEDKDKPESEKVKSYFGKNLEDTYKKMTQREHALHRPSNVIGNIKPSEEECWIYDKDKNRIIKKTIINNEGLIKIFDEGLSNTYDQFMRLKRLIHEKKDGIKPVKNIKVNFDKKTGIIIIENDGNGIDIVKSPTDPDIYVVELLFANYLTSTNYDDNEKRQSIGLNGIGIKACSIFSKEFTVETIDINRKLYYKQRYLDNLSIIEAPTIEKYTKTPFTRITFKPDYERFGFKLKDVPDLDLWKIIERRVYDFSIYLGNECNLWLNNEKLKCSSFQEYVDLYIGPKKETPRVYFNQDNVLDLCVYLLPESEEVPDQISFVNSAFTDYKGKHIDYIYNTLSKKILENYKFKKDETPVKADYIKKYMCVIMKTTIINPEFDSQTKRKLVSNYSDFGVKYIIEDDFIKKLIGLGIMDRAKKFNEFKTKENIRKIDSKKTNKIYDENLMEAEYAGTKNSYKAKLFLVEGLSAAGFFRNGRAALSEEDKKVYACFPLKGKIMNTQKSNLDKISNNVELNKVKTIIGLVEGRKYTKELIQKELRYGKVILLTDQDADSSHIQGLAYSYFHKSWPELIELGFLSSFPTPLIKAWIKTSDDRMPPSNKMIYFYSENEHKEWLSKTPDSNKYVHKYYKGLAGHGAEECRELVKNIIITEYYYGDTEKEKKESKEAIELLFKPKLENKRKQWIENLNINPLPELTFKVDKETLKIFTDYRLINYCNDDNIRSIPSLYDGLKPSQRKALYAFLYTKNKGKDIKVISLSGLMTGEAAYHHGDMSSNEAIINLAQTYIGGSGNLNLLYPLGLFGDRAENGKNHGSPRYISVGKVGYIENLFNKLDYPVLEPNYDDNKKIEPKNFAPILPIVLLTSASGIGFGFSTKIYCYNPHEVIHNMKCYIKKKPMKEMIPWFRGFKGQILKTGENTYLSLGKYTVVNNNEIKITELPVGCKDSKSFNKYKQFLYLTAGFIEKKKKKNDTDDKDKDKKDKKNKKDNEDDNIMQFEKGIITAVNISNEMANEITINVIFKEGFLLNELENNHDYEFEKKMKLAAKFSCNNMNLNRTDGIHLYKTPFEIIEDFYKYRYKVYEQRKEYLLKELNHDLLKTSSKWRFINQLINDEINLNKKKYEVIFKILEDNNYPKFTRNFDDDIRNADYEYLLILRVDSVTEEKLDKLKKEVDNLNEQINILENTTIENMWLSELNDFKEAYDKEQLKWEQDIYSSKDIKDIKNSNKKITLKKK